MNGYDSLLSPYRFLGVHRPLQPLPLPVPHVRGGWPLRARSELSGTCLARVGRCEVNEQVTERVRKILALAGNNPSEHEIAAAMTKARAILAEHGLTVDEFASTDESTPEASEPMESEGLAIVKSTDSWAYTLALGVGALTETSVLYWSSQSGGKKIVMAGQATDLCVARELFAYLYAQAQELSRTAMQTECPAWYERGQKTVWRRTFLQGFADRIRARATDARKQEIAEAVEAKAADGDSMLPAVLWNAIVERKETALAQFVKEAQGKLRIRTGRSGGSRDSGGYSRGYAAGANVGLASRKLIR